MKWTDWKVREQAKGWQPYFAWYPIKINNRWVWLEYVERHLAGWWYGVLGMLITQWEYRLPV